jgi:hypothetical protein
VLTETDILRCARLMIERYGADAAPRATVRANELFTAEQPDAGDIWLRVKAAIERLRPASGGS